MAQTIQIGLRTAPWTPNEGPLTAPPFTNTVQHRSSTKLHSASHCKTAQRSLGARRHQSPTYVCSTLSSSPTDACTTTPFPHLIISASGKLCGSSSCPPSPSTPAALCSDCPARAERGAGGRGSSFCGLAASAAFEVFEGTLGTAACDLVVASRAEGCRGRTEESSELREILDEAYLGTTVGVAGNQRCRGCTGKSRESSVAWTAQWQLKAEGQGKGKWYAKANWHGRMG